jgi:hypothetical protein
VIVDDAVVSHMGAHHEQAVVADARDHAATPGTRVHGHVLADDVVGADDQLRLLARVLQVLRLVADRGEGKDPGVGADTRAAGHDHVGVQAHAVGYLDTGANAAVRADGYVFAEPRALFDQRGRVYLTHATPYWSMIIAA